MDEPADLTGTISTTTLYDNDLTDVGSNNEAHASITNLTSNTLYYFAVSNSNRKNETPIPFTNRSPVDHDGILTLPDNVSNFSTSVSGTTITLTWDNVARSDNGYTEYKLEVSTDSGSTYTDVGLILPSVGSTTSDTYTGVYDTDYTFRITASNGSSTSSPPGGDSGAETALAEIGNAPDNTPPGISSQSWSTDSGVSGSASNGDTVKLSFDSSTDLATISVSSFKVGTTDYTSSVTISTNTGSTGTGCEIEVTIPESAEWNGSAEFVFTLTDNAGNTSNAFTENSGTDLVVDTSSPSYSDPKWYISTDNTN